MSLLNFQEFHGFLFNTVQMLESKGYLFSVYMDGLMIQLRRSNLGCSIDRFYFGVLGYADDLLLLSASRSGLQAMVSMCEEFSSEK